MAQPFRVLETAVVSCVYALFTPFCVFLVANPVVANPVAANPYTAAQSATANSAAPVGSAATADSAAQTEPEPSSEQPTSEPAKTSAITYQLRYKFQPNQTLKYETKQTIIQTGVAPFGQQVETNKVEQRRVYTITNVADSENATASMQFEYVRMERDMGKNNPIVFDTKMKPDDVPQFFRTAAKSLKKKAPTYELRANGISINEEQVEQTPTGGQASFVVPMPETAKAIGETWTTFVEVKVRLAEQMFRTVKLRKTFRLKSVDNGIAEISMSTSTVGSVKDPRVQVQLLQATPSGTIWFDVDRGLVTKKELRFSNTVLNAMGPKTMVSAKGRTIERLL